ncbi:V-type ATP synthase subunit D [bacterium]|nr:V-type ATP synthase subunit D [bacterium]RKZ27899.1 MAG: V-type ATP synthase subunit D [bacterium]
MAILPVGANRMNMMALQRRLVIARKGHKMLKDKQDELMRHFLDIVEEIRGLRARTETVLVDALRDFTVITGALSQQELEGIFIIPAVEASVSVKTERLLNLRVPNFEITFDDRGISYSLANTPAQLDVVMKKMEEALKLLVELAATEKKLELLANEIDTTRRRVNALEYVMIPDLKDTIRYIRMKLEELERGNLTRLMKVKDIIAEKYAT